MLNIQNLIKTFLPRVPRHVLLFDSVEQANEIAFILKGEWDGCNGVIVDQCDEVAVNTAASLIQASWCRAGDAKAVIDIVKHEEIIHRYVRGERIFINVNLRCANLRSKVLSEANLSWAKLNLANLSEANLSQTNLTGVDASETNFQRANLSQAQLIRTNLKLANLEGACLIGANLSHVCLEGANLSGADFRGAKIEYTSMTCCNLTDAVFD
jgi:uncharacterized protein YjbI with pentapeptide repeats